VLSAAFTQLKDKCLRNSSNSRSSQRIGAMGDCFPKLVSDLVGGLSVTRTICYSREYDDSRDLPPSVSF